jgi:hypothetical protein
LPKDFADRDHFHLTANVSVTDSARLGPLAYRIATMPAALAMSDGHP